MIDFIINPHSRSGAAGGIWERTREFWMNWEWFIGYIGRSIRDMPRESQNSLPEVKAEKAAEEL